MNKKTKNWIKEVILSAIASDDYAPAGATDQELIRYAWGRFFAEVGKWRIPQAGRVTAAKDWFQGLALHTPYMNHEILTLGKQAGVLSENATEKAEDSFIENYWNGLAEVFCYLAEETNATA